VFRKVFEQIERSIAGLTAAWADYGMEQSGAD
jgi:hypothetical protein